MRTYTLYGAVLMVLIGGSTACGGDSPEPMAVADRYEATGEWDFSGPVSWFRSPGTFVADAFVDRLSSALSTRFTRNATRDAVHDHFHQRIRAYVNRSLGAAGKAATIFEFMIDLLARVEVEMRLTFFSMEPLRGVNELISFNLLAAPGDSPNHEPLRVDLTGPIQVRGPFDGVVDLEGAITLESHHLLISYGPLIDWISEAQYGFPAYTELSNFRDEFDCDALTEELLGVASSISVGGVDVDLPTGKLESACTSALAALGQSMAALGHPIPIEFEGTLEARTGPFGFYDFEPTSYHGRLAAGDLDLPFAANLRFFAADDAEAVTRTKYFGF